MNRILVIGAGSIGERHINNLLQRQGHRIAVLRTRKLPLRTVAASAIEVLTSWQEVELFQPEAAIICTPTHLHAQQTVRLLQMKVHTLVEKPLAHSSAELALIAEALEDSPVLVMTGYMWREYPLFQRVRRMVQEEAYGRLLRVETHWGEYLPAWHPWEDYRESYVANLSMGGGAALTLSHDIDLVNWIAGPPTGNSIRQSHTLGVLELDGVDESTDLLYSTEAKTICHLAMNLYERPTRRAYRFSFERASASVDVVHNVLEIKSENDVVRYTAEGYSRNDLFVAELDSFFSRCRLEAKEIGKYNSRTIAESKAILNLLEV